MGIKDDNTQTALGAAMNKAGASSQGQQPQQPQSNQNYVPPAGNQQQQPANRGWASLGADIQYAIPLNSTSETLAKFTKSLQDVIDGHRSDTSQVDVTLIPVDRNDGANGVPISYLIVATRLKANKDAGVGYQALIIEGSIDAIATTEEYVPGAPNGKVTVTRTAGDADVPAVRETINKIVQRYFQTDRTFGAIAMVVPRTFTDNLVDVASLKNLASQASYNAALALQVRLGVQPLNVANFIGGGDALQAKLSLDPRPVPNLFNQPVRSDIKLQLISEPTAKSTIPGFGPTGSTLLAEISAYVEPIYQPKLPQVNGLPNMPMFGGPTPDMYRKYIPRIVLTEMRSERLRTIGGQLLALVAAISLRNNDTWLATFMPNRSIPAGEIDLHDIGALNLEVNYLGDPTVRGEPFDIRADNVNTPALMAYMRAIFHEGVVFAIDVSTRGPDTAYNGALAAADDGDTAAINAVLEAANHLSNGNFANMWPKDGEVTLKKGETIYLGHYRRANGELRDLRELQDYLAMMNLLGRTAPDLVRDFSDTFLQTQYPEPMRLAARLEIMRKVDPALVVTGTARRVTLTGMFTDILPKAIAKTNVSIPLTGNTHLDTGTADRAVGNFGAGLVAGGTFDMYNRTVNTQNPVGATGGNTFANLYTGV